MSVSASGPPAEADPHAGHLRTQLKVERAPADYAEPTRGLAYSPGLRQLLEHQGITEAGQ